MLLARERYTEHNEQLIRVPSNAMGCYALKPIAGLFLAKAVFKRKDFGKRWCISVYRRFAFFNVRLDNVKLISCLSM